MCCSYRHGHEPHAHGAETYPADATRYCKCLGMTSGHTDDPGGEGRCCGAATGDDGLCDRCRATCNQIETPEQSGGIVDNNLKLIGSEGLVDSVAAGPGTESAFPQSIVLTGI